MNVELMQTAPPPRGPLPSGLPTPVARALLDNFDPHGREPGPGRRATAAVRRRLLALGYADGCDRNADLTPAGREARTRAEAERRRLRAGVSWDPAAVRPAALPPEPSREWSSNPAEQKPFYYTAMLPGTHAGPADEPWYGTGRAFLQAAPPDGASLIDYAERLARIIGCHIDAGDPVLVPVAMSWPDDEDARCGPLVWLAPAGPPPADLPAVPLACSATAMAATWKSRGTAPGDRARTRFSLSVLPWGNHLSLWLPAGPGEWRRAAVLTYERAGEHLKAASAEDDWLARTLTAAYPAARRGESGQTTVTAA